MPKLLVNGIGKIRATFTPKNMMTLKPVAITYVNERGMFSYQWTSDENERFSNERIWLSDDWPIEGWVPESDLSDIEVIEELEECNESSQNPFLRDY